MSPRILQMDFFRKGLFPLHLLPAFFPIKSLGFNSSSPKVFVGILVLTELGDNRIDGVLKTILLQLAFPYHNDKPSLSLELSPDFLISLLVSGHFRRPEVGVGFGNMTCRAPIMTMPEASMNKNDCVVFW